LFIILPMVKPSRLVCLGILISSVGDYRYRFQNLAPLMPDIRHLKPKFSNNMLSDKTR
jgi:hypothetical protein